ncbi:class I SAM-dependent methyltransferase [Candidatus Woesearchaeota archaeon]|nr:class I SAM-dependent methyltransferase [Candidatus Woesearchaeota archaeon]
MDTYRETHNNYEHGVAWHMQKSFTYNWKTQIERFAQELKGKNILDVGCGGGRDIQEFLKRGFVVDGIDYSKKTIEECKKKLQGAYPSVQLWVRDMRETNLPSAQYDGIWACASLLHLPKNDVARALTEWKRLLKKDGLLFVSVKEGKGEMMLPDKIGKRFFSFFTIDELKELLESTGFTILHAERVLDTVLTGHRAGGKKPAWICVYAKNSSPQ